MIQRILTAIAKWSLARLKNYGSLPMGLPGHRDPKNRCEVYTPKRIKDAWSRFQDCQGDGHYLCKECIHRAPVCSTCGDPATCKGRYEGATEDTYACDECCGHGNEDGHCSMLDPNYVNPCAD